MITFVATKGDSAAKKKPFIIYCPSVSIASQIAELLPLRQSSENKSELRRLELLDTVCPRLPAITSPTLIIAAINAVVFVLMATLGGAGWIEPIMEPYIKYGANNGGFTTQGEWWRLFTNMFLHFGIVHVLINIWVMKDVGRLLERIIGRAHFLVTYIGTGLLASISSVIWYGDGVWSAGASGAVFGIYGTILALSLHDKENLPFSLFAPIRNSSFTFIGYNLFFGLTQEGIDNAAHIGGFISGFAIGHLIATPLDLPQRATSLANKLRYSTIALIAVLAIAILASPRFDYNPYEELEFHETLNQFGEQENTLFRTNSKILDAAENSPKNRDRAINALQKNMIPFYRDWAQTFDQTQYLPDSSTEYNRSLLQDYSQIRFQAYETLLVHFKLPNGDYLEKYWQLIEQADAKIRRLNQQETL